MKTNVLVTGANGQLAKCIKELFQNNEDELKYHFVTKSELDITSYKSVIDYFEENKIQYCINCAAYTNVDQSEESSDKAFKINAKAVGNLAKVCKENKTILIHISTDYVFDGEQEDPYKETDTTAPINSYGKSKLKGELLLKQNLEQYYLIRASWLYSIYEKNFVTTIAKRAKENVPLEIVDNERGSPTSCNELSKFIHFLITNKKVKFGTYHFSASNDASWYDLASYIISFFPNYNRSKLTATGYYKSKAKRPKNSILNIEKTKKVYSKIASWEKGVNEVMRQLSTKA